MTNVVVNSFLVGLGHTSGAVVALGVFSVLLRWCNIIRYENISNDFNEENVNEVNELTGVKEIQMESCEFEQPGAEQMQETEQHTN